MMATAVDPYIPPVQDTSKSPFTSVDSCPTQQVRGPLPNGGVCSTDLRCTFGTETCCGQTFPSVVCSCQQGGTEFACHLTDACFNPQCKTDLPVVTPTLPPVTIVTSTGATTDVLLTVKPRDTNTPTKLPYKYPTKPPITNTLTPIKPPITITLSPTKPFLQTPTTIISTEKDPDAYNSALCPAIPPKSLDKVPDGLPSKASCGYGKVCCCENCRTATTCLNNAGFFQCLTIAIKCTSTCPITRLTLPPTLV